MGITVVDERHLVLESELPIDAALTIAVNHEHASVEIKGTTTNRMAVRGMLLAALSELETDREMRRWYKHMSSTALLLAADEQRDDESFRPIPLSLSTTGLRVRKG